MKNIPTFLTITLSQKRIDKFWNKVTKTDSCWIWKGGRNSRKNGVKAYGSFYPYKAHRVSWALHNGEIPLGFEVCHHCDNPPCVNPSHLFLGTHKDNMEDATKKGRIKAGYTNDVRNHLSIIQKGKKLSPQHIEKIKLSSPLSHTPEINKKRSETMKGKNVWAKGSKRTPEQRKNIRNGIIKMHIAKGHKISGVK